MSDPKNARSMTASLPAVLTMALCLVLVALAIWNWRANGWGTLVWLAAFVAMVAIRTPYARRVRGNVIVTARRDRTEALLLGAMFLTEMILPLAHLATGLFAFADYTLPGWAVIAGATVQPLFLWLFWRSHADLGGNWSPGLEVRQNHALVTNGVYARIRHPMYAAIWLAALSQPLLVQNWIAGALVVPAFAAMWFIRTPNEEALMRERFGEAYDAYCTRAGRLLPRFAR